MTPAAANDRKPRASRAPARRPKSKAQPKALAIPKQKRDEYLDRVANGEDRADIAASLGYTGRLFRSLARNDPEFAALLDEAIRLGKQAHADEYTSELRKARRHVALTDRNPRTLHYESIAYDPDYRAAHTKHQVEMTGPQGGPLEVRVDVTFTQLQELLAQRAGAARDAGGVARLSAVAELSAARSAP